MTIYKLSKNAVLETFDDGGLVLIVPERRLLELNPSAVEIVYLLDGQRTAEQAAAEIFKNHASGHDFSEEDIIVDVLELCSDLIKNGVLEAVAEIQEGADMKNPDKSLFLRNPDVVTREEDPDEGALLFNPDTNQVKVINTTGLFIWQQCGTARTLAEIAAEVQKGFEDAPPEQVAADVQEFVDGMLASGFIGTVESTG